MDGGISIGRKGAGLRPFVQVFGPQVQDTRISDGAYRTLHLLDLLEGADREGTHRMSLIAHLRGIGVRALRYHLKELKEASLIEVEYVEGLTNRILILEPLDIYGREAIGNFYSEVQKANKQLRGDTPGGTRGGGTPAKNSRPPRQKSAGVPRQKSAPPKPQKTDATTSDGKVLQNSKKSGTEYRGTEKVEQSPKGALSPSAPKQSGLPPASGEGPVGGEGRTADCEDPALEAPQNDFMPQEPLKGANPPPVMNQTGRIGSSDGVQTVREAKSPQTVCEKPFTSSRSGSGITIPGEDEEPKRKRKPKGQYDPAIPPDQWDSAVAAGYFRQKFKTAWPGEGAPQASIAALSAIKGRINWLKAEGIGVEVMKQTIDHLFEGWSNGLPSRLKWQGSRPTLALIENIRLFERLVREVQSGTGAHGLVDEYKDSTPEDKAMIEKYAEKDRICVTLMDEGMNQWEAEKEAKRRVGL